MELWEEVTYDDWLETGIFKLWLFAMWTVCDARKASVAWSKLTPRSLQTVRIKDVPPIMTIANSWLDPTLMQWL